MTINAIAVTPMILMLVEISLLGNYNTFTAAYTPAGIYLLKVNNRNSRTRCEICSKLTIRRH